MAIKNGHDRYVYVADEVIFQIVHPSNVGFIDEISDFLDQPPEDNQPQDNRPYWRTRLIPPNGDLSRIVTLSSTNQVEGSERFSLIALKLESKKDNPEDLTQDDVIILLNDAYNELGGQFPIVLKQGDEQGQNVILNSISPNWLASDLHHGGSTGGPGSIPAKKPASAEAQRKFKLKGKRLLEGLLPYKFTEPVQVAILDTAISLDDGIEINKDTGTELPSAHVSFTSEIKDLLTGRTNHCPEPATMEVVFYKDVVSGPFEEDLNLFDPYATWPHHYEMPDHGTFIASIIRAITPCVPIYLYEVLNRFGVGSFISIAEGVQNAVNQRGEANPPKPLVMNCSFMLDHDLESLVLEGDALKALQQLLPPESDDMKPDQKKKRERNQALLELSMRDVFDWATDRNSNVRVVAAAGNDGPFDDEHREPPRYPAAFNNVFSVAALPKGNLRHPHYEPGHPQFPKSRKYIPTRYSNLAHSDSSKESHSFATFGGDLEDESVEPIGGVLGVYIGGIPTQNLTEGTFNPGPANTTAWAHWSGTSFAAPIISALLAAQPGEVNSNNPDMPYSDNPPIPGRPYRTVDNEIVILIRQGD